MNSLHNIQPAVPENLLNAAIVLRNEHLGLMTRVDLPTNEVQYRWRKTDPWSVYRSLNPSGVKYIERGRLEKLREAVLKETFA